VTTGGIYGFGSIQRPHGVLAETVGMMELTGNGKAEVYGMTGFTSPYITYAHLSTNSSSFLLPLSPLQNQNTGLATSYIGNPSSANFDGVGRWNLRYLYTQGTVAGSGQVAATLNVSNAGVNGTLINETPFHLHDVAVLWQGTLFEVGDMSPGETSLVSAQTKDRSVRGNWLSEYGQYNGDITHGLGRSIGSYVASTDSVSQVPDNRVMIVATTNDSADGIKGIPELSTAQNVISDEKMMFVRQYVVAQKVPNSQIGNPVPRLGIPLEDQTQDQTENR